MNGGKEEFDIITKTLGVATARYYIKNFLHDFLYFRNQAHTEETKSQEQKEFESYLTRNGGVIIIDYLRTVYDMKYFYTVSNCIDAYLGRKKVVLYSSKDLTYSSPYAVFYKYNIPKGGQPAFKNILSFLFPPESPGCHSPKGGDSSNHCDNPEVFYYCINCARYTCKKCVYSTLKAVVIRNDDVYYLDCPCGKGNVLYRLPKCFNY